MSMEDEKLGAAGSEEIPDAFVCCVCLDLLYKPIVLPCGHISCFWCVNKCMNGYRESKCPICRHPYYHFPTICEMLHFLFLKMFPLTYKRRENQILEEEKQMGCFSPQFDMHQRGSEVNEKVEDVNVEQTSIQDLSFLQNLHDYNNKKISVMDVVCSACKLLLFHPMVLNCGHVFCEGCIVELDPEIQKCQICQSMHPAGLPKVCLMLDQFLKDQFPDEYSLRGDSIQLKQGAILNHESSVSTSANCPHDGGTKGEKLQHCPEFASKVHFGAGCDSCGMYPIIGDRYKCKDCVEDIGFDLCGDCYNTCSKRPGRFNQQHTPEHKFERIRANIFSSRKIRIVTGQLDDGSTALFIAGDSIENDDGSLAHILSAHNAREEDDNFSSSSVSNSTNINETDQDDSQSNV